MKDFIKGEVSHAIFTAVCVFMSVHGVYDAPIFVWALLLTYYLFSEVSKPTPLDEPKK
jgi:hypothetical protein